MTGDWRVHWLILNISIRERLTYRADFAFATLVRFLPLVTQIFLWAAIYAIPPANSPAVASTDTSATASVVATNRPEQPRRLNGYTYGQMIGYYLLANLARAFSSMPGLASSIARDIRDGSIKRFLTQPVDLLAFFFWGRMAHKLVYYTVAAGPFALVFYLCREFFEGWPSALTWAAFLYAVILAFLLGFLIESLIGLAGFWFLEVSSVVFIFMMLNYFLSGHMLPLDFLVSAVPPWVGQVLMWLPFQYLSYFPATVMLGRYTPEQLGWNLLAATAWVIALVGLNRLVLTWGIRRYSAYGG